MRTVQELYTVYEHGGEFSNAIIFDLFGLNNWPKDLNQEASSKRLTLFDGIYKGLYLMNVPAKIIETHRRANKLDDLIHDKYKGRESEYYKKFCEQKVVIGPTQLL